MRVHVVSDVHFRTDGLAEAATGSDLFLCLGDLILFLDYDDPSLGIFADLFGGDNARRYVQLRTANRWDEARQWSRHLWASLGVDTWTEISGRVSEQYSRLFEVMPGGLLTYGNVDVPTLWADHLRPDHRIVDGETVEVAGVRFGFVGGGLPSPMRTPFEIPEDEYDAKIAALGDEVDVLCAHLPPAVPELTYDVVSRRFERGSAGLLAAIWDLRPRYLLHGHVHQPLVPRMRIGRTEVINVGHFRARGTPFVLNL